MTVRYDTSAEPARRRLALWQDIVCDVFVQLDCKSDLADFHGAVAQSKLGELSLARVASSQQRVFRTPSRIARAKEDYLLVAFGADGVGGVVQDGRETLIRPGAFAFYDTTRPYELSFDADFVQTILQIPRRTALAHFGAIEDMTAMAFAPDQPLHRLASDFITGLARVVDDLEDSAAERLSAQALDLIALAIAPPAAKRHGSRYSSALLYRLKSYIHAHLADPSLSLSGTAAALGMSSRHVNNLLAAQDCSFGRYVLASRLDQCRRNLADPSLAHRQISEIAFAWDFNDQSHFSSAFRERYGVSPRDYRSRGLE